MEENLSGTLAIDLGNTNTVIAFQDQKGINSVLVEIPNITSSPGVVPTAVWFEEPSKIPKIGMSALKMRDNSNSDLFFHSNFKRLFGNYGYPIGNLKGKKAVVFCTYGSPQFAVRTFFLNMPTKRLRRGVFNICGITDVVYRRYFAVPFVGEKKRKQFLDDVKKTAHNV